MRHDVVMREKKRIGFDELQKSERPDLHSLIQENCIKWLLARSGANGFCVEPVMVTV
jgi:hypothetical protein